MTAEERDAAEAACSEVILALWSRRQHWPYGAPLHRVAEALSAFAGPPEQYEWDRPSAASGWLWALGPIDRLGTEEWEVVRHAAIAQMDLSEERELLASSANELDEKERELLDWLIAFQERQRSPYFKLGPLKAAGFGDMSPTEQAQLVNEALAEIGRQRAVALVMAKASGEGTSDSEGTEAETDTPDNDTT